MSAKNNFKKPNEKKKESSTNIENKIPGNEEPKEIKEEVKLKKPRFKLDEKSLLFSDNGIKKLYELLETTSFKENASETHNLNKFMVLFKNWHFMCFPKYDIDFFISKISDMGKQPPTRAYMSRLRKIYKGEETWDVMYKENEHAPVNVPEIFAENPAQITKEKEINPQEAVFNFSQSKMPKTHLNKINEKFDTMDISHKAKDNLKNDDMQELQFEDLSHAGINENDYPEIDEKDFDNFDHVYQEKTDVDNISSFSNSFYKRDKRLFNETIKNNETISVDGRSIASNSDTNGLISKKMKIV